MCALPSTGSVTLRCTLEYGEGKPHEGTVLRPVYRHSSYLL